MGRDRAVKTDSFGVTHPEGSDAPTLLGALHIAECQPCKERFGLVVAVECMKVAEAFERERQRAPLAALQPKESL